MCMMDLYKNYNEKYGGSAAGIETYRKIFLAENIGFSQPSADECEQCLEYKVHTEEVTHTEEDLGESKICSNFPRHKQKYRKARHEYTKGKELAKDSSIATYTADTMKVFLIPKLKSKEHVFISRLIVFNETFATLNKDVREHLLMLWHEGVAGCTAQDVAASYLKCMKVAGDEKFIFWADNCGGQNKNWFLFTVFVKCVNNADWNVSPIRMKYLHKGHTYMKADSLHGSFGEKSKAHSEILDFQKFSDMLSLKENGEMCRDGDFYDFSSEVRNRKTKAGATLPLLEGIVEVEFRKNDRKMFYKTSFSNKEHVPCDFLLFKCNVELFPTARNVERGISCKKKNDILNLLRVVPKSNRLFWEALEENSNVKDLMASNELVEKPVRKS